MELQITTPPSADYLLAEIAGHWNRDEILSYPDRVAEECRQQGKKRVLVDAGAIVGPIPDLDRFLLGERIAEAMQGVRVAAIVKPELITKFTEDVAVNRGAIFHVTSQPDDALQWLLNAGVR